MKRSIPTLAKRITAYASGLLLVFFTTAAHVSAMPLPMNTMNGAMGGMKHDGMSASPSCATLCTTATTQKDNKAIRHVREERNDELEQPYYIQFQRNVLSLEPNGKRSVATTIPEGRVPIYLMNSLLRI